MILEEHWDSVYAKVKVGVVKLQLFWLPRIPILRIQKLPGRAWLLAINPSALDFGGG